MTELALLPLLDQQTASNRVQHGAVLEAAGDGAVQSAQCNDPLVQIH